MDIKAKIAAAMEYLAGQDLKAAEVGKYIVNDDFYYLVQSYNSKAEADGRLETHDKYLDIQIVVSGKEAIDFCVREGLEEKAPYNPDKDITFYYEPAVLGRAVLTDGSYMVLYPEIAHKPGLAVGESVPIRKVVAKIKL